MTSRLFRALVCVGISLGSSATAACSGAISENAEDSGTTNPPDATPDQTTPTFDAAADTTVDVRVDAPADGGIDAKPDVRDAAVDAPKDAIADVIADAFCDAAWPTTKGNPKPPACTDPLGECADAGFPEHCYQVIGPFTCDYDDTTAPFCVNKAWQCSPNTVHVQECRCFGPIGPNDKCTDAGLVRDAGGGG
jgi:hypothetical protein